MPLDLAFIEFIFAQQGTPLPEIELQEGAPDKNVKLTDIFKGKKGILFGVPGAFTPGCSKVPRDAAAFDEYWTCFAAACDSLICLQTHLPGYVNDYSKLSEAGAQVIACVAVNDAFVMKAWGEQSGAEAKVSWIHLMLIIQVCMDGRMLLCYALSWLFKDLVGLHVGYSHAG